MCCCWRSRRGRLFSFHFLPPPRRPARRGPLFAHIIADLPPAGRRRTGRIFVPRCSPHPFRGAATLHGLGWAVPFAWLPPFLFLCRQGTCVFPWHPATLTTTPRSFCWMPLLPCNPLASVHSQPLSFSLLLSAAQPPLSRCGRARAAASPPLLISTSPPSVERNLTASPNPQPNPHIISLWPAKLF